MLGWRLQHFTNALFRVCSARRVASACFPGWEWRRPIRAIRPAREPGNAGFSERESNASATEGCLETRVRPNAISAVRRRHPVAAASRTLAYQQTTLRRQSAGWEASLEFPSQCWSAKMDSTMSQSRGLKRQLRGGTFPKQCHPTAPAKCDCALGLAGK